jgi:hypothetical protein
LEGIVEQDVLSPLEQMDIEERIVADYRGTGLTTGLHPMFYKRAALQKENIKSAAGAEGARARQKSNGRGRRHYAAASRHGKGAHLCNTGRRNGECECDHHAGFL